MATTNRKIAKYIVNIALLASLLVSGITGIFKFTLLMRMLGLNQLVFPLAFMSDIHDWSGVALIILVAIHLILNGGWLWSMTKKIVSGTVD